MKQKCATTEKIVIHRCVNGYLLREAPDSYDGKGRMWAFRTVDELREGFVSLINDLLDDDKVQIDD